MIDFQPSESSIYEANKAYCQSMADQLAALGFHITGFCTAYGFTITASRTLANQHLLLELNRSQTTRGGTVLLNPEASNSDENHFSITGLPVLKRIRYGQFGWGRLFASASIKSIIPPPGYLWANPELPAEKVIQLNHFLNRHRIFSLKTKQGKLRLKSEGILTDPQKLLSDTDQLIQTCLRS